MLRELRKKIIKKKDNKSLEDFLGKESRKYYVETHYKNNFLYKYLYFLRTKGADLNAFFDNEITEDKKP
ncbi:hypothetical protein LNP80_22875 [Chryseobacterium sp. C-39]|uniref:Uncharacterized protein n=2 Tax=Chryseobacterium TaxID=59732 RepID=A0A9Q3YTQ3_9FLAO|nr:MULTISPECIES: hypothetical protein [Chryseobacterium]MCC9037059.1 hypothetical protein [Chryseobacterium muglaense]REC56239.1 hypothetical protein DRF62_04010 [Chryseobacterium piscium]